jgi:indole-3-glycerol phosphate synthase
MPGRPDRVPTILQKILKHRRERLAREMRRVPRGELEAVIGASPAALDFVAALSGNGVRIIAEMKPRSPSAGVIREHFCVRELQLAYDQGGADAFSVLTEEDFFGGSLENLIHLRRDTRKPILRKDFLFHPYQIYESRAAGADAVLLIAAMLSPGQLGELLALATELGLAVLVEVHTTKELVSVCGTGARLIGINNRDLHTFRVDLDTSIALRPHVPPGLLTVSESGIKSRADIERLAAAGIHCFLIGEHLMRAPDIPAALGELKRGLP